MKSLKLYFESLLDDDDIFLDPKTDKNVVKEWIKNNYKITGKLTIFDDFVVNCTGGVYVKNKSITSLTNGLFRWGKVDGHFTCSFTPITSLEGAPEVVGENFDCSGCVKLKTLEGSPEYVDGTFSCDGCRNLKSLEGAPEEVCSNFICSDCESLESLEGAPKIVGKNFHCDGCRSLKSLEGTPKEVGGYFNCHKCINLKSLEGAPEKIGGCLNCRYCDSLKITNSDRKKYKLIN